MQQFFIDKKSENLVIFLCGWGMDERPLLPLSCDSNVLYLYNYSNLELNFNFSIYKNIKLISFSCGVYMAGILKEILPQVDYSVAVNGTLNLLDEEFGLPIAVVDVFKNISLDNYLEFREKWLLSDSSELEKFNQNQPHVSIESAIAELEKLKVYAKKEPISKFSYDKILISTKDKIVPTQNQKNFWKNDDKVYLIECAHFPFYKFSSIEDLINFEG